MRKTMVGSVVVAAAMVLVGCSGSDDASAPPTSTTSPSPSSGSPQAGSSQPANSPSAGSSSAAPNPDEVDLATDSFPVSWPLKQATDAAHEAHDGRIKKLKLEGKSSGARYEFDIAKGGSEDGDYEVQVNAMTCKVTSTGD